MDVDAPVVVGGIIPEPDQIELRDAGVAGIYTPKDYRFAQIMAEVAELGLEHRRNRTKHSTAVRGEPMDSP
jgi:(2R)-ethylmalonyl-CoA mutase